MALIALAARALLSSHAGTLAYVVGVSRCTRLLVTLALCATAGVATCWGSPSSATTEHAMDRYVAGAVCALWQQRRTGLTIYCDMCH